MGVHGVPSGFVAPGSDSTVPQGHTRRGARPAWALDIAPTNLIVPFEKPDPVTRNDAGEKIDPPLYKTSATLHIGAGVDMQPVEARAWIAGRSVRHDTDRR